MVWRIFSGVTIFMDPLMDEFTLMESKIFIIMEYAQQRKSLLETMNSWDWGDFNTVGTKTYLRASSPHHTLMDSYIIFTLPVYYNIIFNIIFLHLRTCDSTQECWPGDASPGRGRQPWTLRIWWAGYWPRLAGLSRRTGGDGDQHCCKYHQDLHFFILHAPLGVTGASILSLSVRLQVVYKLYCVN